MAINPGVQYPGQIDTTDPAGYPLGKAQNITVPSDGTGTPWEKALVNDIFGFQQALLGTAGIFPSGNADKWGVSQYLQACYKLFGVVYESIADMQAAVSSELPNGTMVSVFTEDEFMFGEVVLTTLTDDGIRNFPFDDDANKGVVRTSTGYVFNWSGTFGPLGGVDDGRFLLPDGTYSATPPAVSDYRFPEAGRLIGMNFSNRGSGAKDISGLAFWADPAPTTATPTTLEFQLTPKVDILANEIRFIPVTDGAPDLSSPMALAFTARDIEASDLVKIQFVFILEDEGRNSQTPALQRGDLLAPVEAAGVVDLADRIADHNYPAVQPQYNQQYTKLYGSRNLDLNGSRNLHRYTEDPSNATYFDLTSASASIDSADVIRTVVDGAMVQLMRLEDTSADTLLWTDYPGVPYAPFATNGKYIVSFYVVKATEGDCRFHMRGIGSPLTSPGHGARIVGNRPRRVWTIVEAQGADQVKINDDPAVQWSAKTARDLEFFGANLGALTGDLSDVYIGGFQVEQITGTDGTAFSASPRVNGIAMIGDEIMSGVDQYPAFSDAIRTAGNPDDVRSLQVSRWIESELNAEVYNRAVAGDTLDDMNARWATDITPLKGLAAGFMTNYVIIQGGANDIVAGFDASDSAATVLAALKVSIAALHAKALADDMIPVYLTITPSPGIYGERNTTRQDYNKWLTGEYGLVIDINQVVESSDGQSIVRQPGYTTDGFNFDAAAKEAVGRFVARQPVWAVPTPAPYGVVFTTTPLNLQIDFEGISISVGSGDPEGAVNGSPGDRYWRDDPAGGSTSTYVKISGFANTGWQAV